MTDVLMYILYAGLILSSIMSVVYSFKSRRSTDPVVRGSSSAKMNIWMGFMLIILSITQMFIFSGSTLRVIIGAVFMVLGAFNIFAGIRNNSYYSRQQPK